MTSILRTAVAALIVAALTGAAGAADLPGRYPPPVMKAPVYSPMYNWTGFYLGLNGGGAWGHTSWDHAGGFDVSGGLVGGTAGYNWQTGQFVFGLEGDIDWTHINGTLTNVVCPFGCTTSDSWL